MKKYWKAAVAIALVLALGFGCGIYLGDYYEADATALAALNGSDNVQVTQAEDMVVFSPEEPNAGLIFYPGGKVEYTAYAPLMQALAEQDVLCVLVRMPFHLAVLDMNAADGIAERFPQVDRWYLGGHSLGGSMAANYAASHGEDYAGLVLLAAYATKDLTATDLDVISLYGSQDGVMRMEKYETYREMLPEDTVEYVIEGGNHAGFGSYGAQDGDGEAAISREEQIRMTVAQLCQMFEKE